MSSAYGLGFGLIYIIFMLISLGITALAIYVLILAIKALKIYIRKNS